MRSVPFSSDIKYTSLGDILFSIFGTFSLYTDVYIPGEYMGLMFNTVVILGDGLDAATIYPGLGDNSSPPSEKSSCYDMIEEICNYFGWTAHDYGSSLWFIGVDNTQYNRYEIDYDHKELVADATAYTVADIGITLAGAKNKYKYVAGSSYIDWQQRVKTSFTLVRTNLADCTTFGGLSGNAQQYIYKLFVRVGILLSVQSTDRKQAFRLQGLTKTSTIRSKQPMWRTVGVLSQFWIR
jgi:hypothetical protein